MMTKITGFIAIFILFVLVTAGSAQEKSANHKQGEKADKLHDNAPPELQSKINSFFEKLIDGKIDDGYKQLLTGSPMSNKDEQVKNLIDQTKKATELYGKMFSFELVNYEFASGSLVRLRYLTMHSDFPMRWLLTFYKSPDRGWIIINIKFDDLSEMFFSDE
jgi:hypothetical protein